METTKLFTLLLCFLSLTTYSQRFEITGSVSSSSAPLPEASVLVKGTRQGTQTDLNGNYRISVRAGAVLIVSYLGFKNKEVVVRKSGVLNITLQEDHTHLDEVLIVAYGATKKASFTGSAVQLDAKTIEKRPLTNVMNALDGQVTGVKLTPANGQPGSSPSIRIRGFGSISASNSPLIILDGVQYTGGFSNINSNDIASISVLKDAASTSLYGSRAANGVVLITTKKGRKNAKGNFSLTIDQGYSTRAIPEYKRVNAYEYYTLQWEALRNGYLSSGIVNTTQAANHKASDQIFTQLGINPFNVDNMAIVLPNGLLNPNAKLKYKEDLNWQAPLMRAGLRNSVNFSYSYANDNADYFTSLSYVKEEGYLINTDFERITARINLNQQLNSWLKMGANLAATTKATTNANDDSSSSLVNPFRTTRFIAPIYPVHLHNPSTGAYQLDSEGVRRYDASVQRVGFSTGRNVVQETLLNKRRTHGFLFTSRVYGQFKLADKLTCTLNAASDKSFSNYKSFQNPIVGDAAPEGRLYKANHVYTTTNFNQLLNYSTTIGPHQFSVLLGHENILRQSESFIGKRYGMILDDLFEFNNFESISSLTSGTSKLHIEGYFSNIKYNYDKKYYISASYRRDGSSRFLKNKIGNFYSIGASWILNKEKFLNHIDWVNSLKIRTSYGEVGNENIGSYYIAHPSYSLGYNNQGDGGIKATKAGNPNLTWETNVQTDIALEYGLFDNQITGTIEYYQRSSKGLLFEVPLPVSSGLSTYPDNIGTMRNNGFEMNIATKLIKNSNFSWDFSMNAATIKNKITNLPQKEIIKGSKKLIVGGDIYAYWMRQWYGVDPLDGAALYVLDTAKKDGSSDERLVQNTAVTTDQNKALYHFAGTALPDLYGGFTHTFNYRGIQLGFTFSYQLGGKTYDSNYAHLMESGTPGVALSSDIKNRWQHPGDITNVPRLDNSKVSAFGAFSDRWLVNSDYLMLRQLQLTFNLPNSLNQRFGIQNSQIYLNGENLWLTNARQGLEPSQNFDGTTSNRFSPSKIITLGVRLTF